MSLEARAVIRRPILTEKSMRGSQIGKYTFEVADDASKSTIKDAVERLFAVTVTKVNTVRVPGRLKRRGAHTYRVGGYKKAIVTLAPGEKIDLETLT
ncbi:MAG: 50S ribosomal protein L23 [Armatimonadota bacterium]|nr:50S ribosomal protein L23 [Armatimonadota bacterium]MDR7452627.1 50S ribosomal protein L23 [Armatimonadota bacterium]MDR7468188.1 50S ribosomal protein L23 [Armatimonadota bacterium]MDR7495182.1 50S ribosomal protein L23 [Armatimonadota bacterium]MDR7499316.1 50S ribosomal protein L23 [Armatimonadota bacterium]